MSLGLKEGSGNQELKTESKLLSAEELKKAFQDNSARSNEIYDLTKKFRTDEIKDKKDAATLVETAFDLQGPASKTDSIIVDPKVNETIAQAKSAVKDGNPAGFDIGKMFGNVGKEIKDFFKSIFGPIIDMFKRLATQVKKDEKLTELIKDDSQWKILESYGVTTSDGKIKGTTELQFIKEAEIVGTRKTEAPKDAQGNAMNNESSRIDGIKINDGKIIVEKDSKISEVKEVSGGITLTVKNKDGTIDTYTVANIKKIEPQKIN